MSSLRIVAVQRASLAVLLPMYPAIACGWPSPALDWSEAELSLDDLVGVDAVSTKLAWVTDGALSASGICQGDVLVVDMAIQPAPGDIVLALFDGEHYLRRLSVRGAAPALVADMPSIAPLMIGEESEVLIQGVASWLLHAHPGASLMSANERAEPTHLDQLAKIGQCSTFLVRARGESMLGAGIRPGDILVVDRSCEPMHGYIVVAIVGGEFTLKRLGYRGGEPTLNPENDLFTSIPLIAEDQPELWGTCTWNLRKLLQR